jgi:hypothetical protein
MGNVIYDLLPGSALSPFFGGGIGVNHTKVDVTGQFSNITGAISAANPAIQNLVIDDKDLLNRGIPTQEDVVVTIAEPLVPDGSPNYMFQMYAHTKPGRAYVNGKLVFDAIDKEGK